MGEISRRALMRTLAAITAVPAMIGSAFARDAPTPIFITAEELIGADAYRAWLADQAQQRYGKFLNDRAEIATTEPATEPLTCLGVDMVLSPGDEVATVSFLKGVLEPSLRMAVAAMARKDFIPAHCDIKISETVDDADRRYVSLNFYSTKSPEASAQAMLAKIKADAAAKGGRALLASPELAAHIAKLTT